MRLLNLFGAFEEWWRWSKYKKLRRFDPELVDFLVCKLGVFPNRLELYHIALTPRGAPMALQFGMSVTNERLEYLGDAVLELVVSDFLFHRYPLRDEGILTQMRSYLVCRNSFNHLSDQIGLAKLGAQISGGLHFTTRMKGDLLEAFFGALFLDLGYESARRAFVDKVLMGNVDFSEAEIKSVDAKSALYIWAKKKDALVCIDVKDDPDRPSYFLALVYVDGKLLGQASAVRKKFAEQAACERVCEVLSIRQFNSCQKHSDAE